MPYHNHAVQKEVSITIKAIAQWYAQFVHPNIKTPHQLPRRHRCYVQPLLIINFTVAALDLLLELLQILVPQIGSFSVQWRGIVRLPQQALKTQEYGLDVVSGSPLVLEDVQADATGEVHIWMVDGSLEENRRWGVRVVGRESEGELEGKIGVWGIVRSFDCRSPREEIAISGWECRDTWGSRGHQLHELSLETFGGALSIGTSSRGSKLCGLRSRKATRCRVLRVVHGEVHCIVFCIM